MEGASDREDMCSDEVLDDPYAFYGRLCETLQPEPQPDAGGHPAPPRPIGRRSTSRRDRGAAGSGPASGPGPAVALPMIAEMLGVPAADRATVEEQAERRMQSAGGVRHRLRQPRPTGLRRPRALRHDPQPQPSHRLGFGHHVCLGQHPARLEGADVFRAPATRFPDMQLADGPLSYARLRSVRSLNALPVALHASQAFTRHPERRPDAVQTE